MEMEASVIKGGETCIAIWMRRSSAGLTLSVKTHPRVEEFLRTLSGGNTVPVLASGRYWVPLPGQGDTFIAYAMGQKLDAGRTEDGSVFYTLDRLGTPLLEEGRLNLSFLRLVGTSDGAGITFGVRGVYSLEQLRQIRDKLNVAAKQFYIDYLRPTNLQVEVVTQEFNG